MQCGVCKNSHAVVLNNNSCLWRQLLHPLLVRLICALYPNGQCLLRKEGASKSQFAYVGYVMRADVFSLQVLAALTDNAKHNQQGQVDEHNTLRH